MPAPTRQSFKIPTEWLCFHWSSALSENRSWGEMINIMMEDEEFMKSNESFFGGDSKFATSARQWAEDTYSDKSGSYRTRMYKMFVVSEKVLTKMNNLRSRKDFKNAEGLSIDRPHGVSDRIGKKSGDASKRLNWAEILKQFSPDDYNGK